ncbi:ATP-binding cassette domain-containing protein [Aureimonas sp. SK2]|uniref:ATP-binding cassette domain-containing protein n=1 Tax=Aureimonas sp. SK2 TaxID=3015992 RepID=UPI00244385FA|nr:ATP-binding cassette domain-containing protein [Aureimonas sp. SK2]
MIHERPAAMGAATALGPPLVVAEGLGKTYGTTVANADLTFSIGRGEIVGLVGANGAGKSTLMRVLCGVTEPDTGRLVVDGAAIEPGTHSPRAAQALGIRIVWQELSLLPNLTVAENFYVERPGQAGLSPAWRRTYARLAEESLEAIFPKAGIAPSTLVADLSIAERQMLEIARAASDPRLRLLILDEPTSSLGSERSAQLRRFIARRAAEGLAVVFISHKLAEVLAVSTRVMAMRNGRLVWQRPSTETAIADLVTVMGGAAIHEAEAARAGAEGTTSDAPVLVRIDGPVTGALGYPVELRAGEIVGLAGLEGSGQKPILQAIFEPRRDRAVQRMGRASFVSGDRQREGVFPLWSVLQNIAIGRIAGMRGIAPVRDGRERSVAANLADRLGLDRGRIDSPILDLSGGNQQKAIVARALADDADIILLDDPTRGVDIGAKRDFYGLVGQMADARRLVVWHSTEDLEFLECDRVLVFAGGQIVRELRAGEISEDAIVAASFVEAEGGKAPAGAPVAGGSGLMDKLLRVVPFASLVLVFAIMASLNPRVASAFGLELLLAPAVTLVLVAIAQMFVVGGSEIDLGVGAFTGLVNVVSATILVVAPGLGLLCLAGGLLAYGAIGLLIQARAIPAIVVTLGTSFIFAGLGQTIQASPGGSSPEWLSGLLALSVPGVPTPVVLILLAGALAFLIDRSPVGTVLRGFGSSPLALQRCGWSPVRYAVLRYLIAGSFATVAGLYLTAANGASDINAGASFTLLSIAAVVIGGCQLMGGVIRPVGTVAGAVTLALIGALLASLGVSTDYNAAVQGALLIAILSLQTLAAWRAHRG